ncbi:MAG TPA: OmpH family outer membrane protein [Flavisolibacter sp.]|nr:OmpH family outer membrane protein [Flavisolibacter sp.]
MLLVLVGVLFYLHFSSKNPSSTKAANNQNVSAANAKGFKIAYFEMDSVETSFQMVKDVKAELTRKEEAIGTELERMEKTYRNKVAQYQAQGANMTQVQSEMAQRDVMQMQQNMQSRRQSLEQEYQDLQMRKLKDVKSKIEDFLKQYNTDKGYTYIFAYEPGIFYYKDTTYNITADVIKGLNQQYGKK